MIIAFAVLLAVIMGLIVFQYSFIPKSASGSRNAVGIADLYRIVLVVAIAVFLGVEGALAYSIVRYRHRRGRGQVAAQIRGNTRLEVGWTVGAALILVVLTVVTFAMLSGIKDPERSGAKGLNAGGVLYAQVDQPPPPGGRKLTIAVNGQQYIWRFTYPNKAFSYETMVVPVDTTVTLDIRSQDVAHSWWIPDLGGKFDAIPGYTNHTWFKISRAGVYEGQCAELCGRNHANMLARVRAVPVDEYEAWVTRQQQLINTANQAAAAERQSLSPVTSQGP